MTFILENTLCLKTGNLVPRISPQKHTITVILKLSLTTLAHITYLIHSESCEN